MEKSGSEEPLPLKLIMACGFGGRLVHLKFNMLIIEKKNKNKIKQELLRNDLELCRGGWVMRD